MPRENVWAVLLRTFSGESITFAYNWVDSGTTETIWLPGFYSPRALLATIRLNYARKQKISVDLINLNFSINPEVSGEDSTIISGLFLSGARFDEDEKCLAELEAHQLHDKLPEIACIPSENNQEVKENTYLCPVYVLRCDRADMEESPIGNGHFIMTIPMPIPTESTCDHWILRGVSGLCQLN
ncbi:hypothetical protein DMENIID0001_149510 [Sergentomyia squamirostris]